MKKGVIAKTKGVIAKRNDVINIKRGIWRIFVAKERSRKKLIINKLMIENVR